MTNRITKKDLHKRIERLNGLFGYESDALPHCFRLDCAYGGYRVARLCANGSGESDVSPRGTARETYWHIHMLIAGAEMALRKHQSDFD